MTYRVLFNGKNMTDITIIHFVMAKLLYRQNFPLWSDLGI